MTIDVNKLITIAGLENFKTRQDAANDLKLLKRSNIAMDGNEIAFTKTEAATGVEAVVLKALTSGSSLDATKLSGTVPIGCMPAGALERIYIAATEAARLALTTSEVQNGDVVKVTEGGKMYFVKDDSKLGTAQAADAFEVFVAGEAAAVAWSNVTNKPSFGTSAGDFAEGNHTHGNISNDGKVGSTADLPLITGTAGAVSAGNWATGANASSATAFVNGADSRLSDSRDPNDHASNKVTAMTGYTIASSAGDIAATDSLNGAIGKLEKKADVSAASINMANYSKAGSVSAVSTSDSVIQALGKLEAAVDNTASNAEIDEEIFGITA